MYGFLRNGLCAYLCNLQCGISDECLPVQGCDMFCGRIRRVFCKLKRVDLGETLQLCVVAEELLLLWKRRGYY